MKKHSNIKLLLTARRISVTVGINKFIRFLQKLPLVGNHVSDNLYSNKDTKLGIFAVVVSLKAIEKIILKALYVGLMLFLIPSVIPSLPEDDLRIVFNIDAVMLMFFSVAFIGASLAFAKCINFDVGQDLVMLDKFRADSNIYMPLRIIEHKIYDFILYFPYVFVLALTEKYTILDGIIILVTLELVKIIFEAIMLFSFSLLKNINSASYKILSYIYVGLGVVSIIVPLIMISASGSKIIDVKPILVNPITFILTAGLAALAIIYIKKYKYYRELAWSQIVHYNLTLEKVKVNQKNQLFGDAQKWNKSSENDVYLPDSVKKLHGYAFFNSLFFFRHKKYFRKKILLRSAALLAAGVIALSGFFIVKSGIFGNSEIEINISGISEVSEAENSEEDDELAYSTSLQIFVFFAYIFSIGRQATAAMFSNCDITMLRYKFYRERKIIIGNFNTRLKKILTLNIPIFISMMFSHLVIDYLIYQKTLEPFFTPEKFITTIAAFTVLWLFFSFHDLFIYYIVQPYNEEYAAKNIWFTIVQMIVYMACYMNIFIDTVNIYAYTGLIAIITVSYFILGMLAIYRFSEKTFKLR